MKNLILVDQYKSILNLFETQVAIKLVKDTFERELAEALQLTRVSAPLFVEPQTGLNDNLSGVEQPVSFTAREDGTFLEIVHSLAKWKRFALKKYECSGIYTDMNAIRPFEDLDNIHSLYVDQWDWEKVILKNDRNEAFLQQVVKKIYTAFLHTAKAVTKAFPSLTYDLPKEMTFITTEELEQRYPNLSRKERELAITREYGAVFLMHIGNPLSDGEPHDARAADYDDWNLNGDFLVYYKPLNIALEISSMGIRVDQKSLEAQCKAKGETYKLELPYHQAVLHNDLPLTIGGGIGQSRLCMFFLQKAHIGEVQASYWPKEDLEYFQKNNIYLL